MCIFTFTADDTASITSSDQASAVQTPDHPDVFPESEIPPPQPMELEFLAAQERKKIVSSFENVYTGVPLEPTVNRMSMDASEIDIGDRFDSKQPDSKLQSDLSSSYEKLYEKAADKSEAEGECKSESASTTLSSTPTTLSSASAVNGVCSTYASTIHSSYPATGHSCPVYITVESGLDKLACSTKRSTPSVTEYMGHSTRVKGDLAERSVSYDAPDTLEEKRQSIFRPCSSPDVFSPVETGFPVLGAGRGT